MSRSLKSRRSYPYFKKSSSSSLVKRAKGNLTAAKKQNDTADFVITFTHGFAVTSATNADALDHNINSSGYILNIWDLLAKAPNFQAFKSMYDQVRINGVQIKLQSSNATVSTANLNQVYDIYTAWDINGIDDDKIKVFTELVNPDEQDADASSHVNPTSVMVDIGEEIATYGSAVKMQLNPFQRWSQNRSIYPSNMVEKTQFVSTESIKEWHEPFNPSSCSFELGGEIKNRLADVAYADVETLFNNYVNNSDNPAVFSSNGKYPFKPTLLVNAFSTGYNQENNPSSVNCFNKVTSGAKLFFTAEVKVPCTFRGLKGVPNV